MDLKILLTSLADLAPGIKTINALIKESRGTKREVLRELHDNIDRIALYQQTGMRADGINRVVNALQVATYLAASKAGFDFNALQKRKLAAETVRDVPQFKSLVGLSTEQLFDKVYAAIHRLRIICAEYPDDPKLRKNVRLINIFKLMLVLVRHIKSPH
jgi:hypothetical protein